LEKKRNVIRASIDGFHNPDDIRYTRGKDSPEGYYCESFNYDALTTLLLQPLGPNGNLKYKTSVFDFRTNTDAHSPTLTAQKNSILIFDGVFLLRQELFNFWDFKIFVEVDFEESLRRAVIRDKELLGDETFTRERYLKRYIPGQKIYLEAIMPKLIADVVINNNDVERPALGRN
jgi:uridine kinase